MDNTFIQKIQDLLGKYNNIAIAIGKNPTIDEMAGALSLYLLLTDAKKNVSIACPTDPIVELSNLVGINKVARKLDAREGDLTVSFPYSEGEIEKVSYTLENGFLNIIVKATEKPLSFNERDVRFIKGGSGIDLLFVIGTPISSDLGDIVNPGSLKNTKIINIDNKKGNQGFGDIVIVSTEYSSVSEIVGDILLSLGFSIDRDVAQNLLDGITYATGNFQNEMTSPLAFEIASLMMRNGAVRREQSNQLPQRAIRNLRLEEKPQNQPTLNPANGKQNAAGDAGEQNAPNDWLTPKVYKGSSNF